MRTTAFLSVLSVLMLVACGGSAPLRSHYLLRAEPVERSGRLEVSTRVGLGRVAVSPYLDRDGIVVETESGQVRAAKLHLWAEPLEAALRSTLRDEISRDLGSELSLRPVDQTLWDYRVDIYVDRLHGSMTGSAILDASYRITPRSGRAIAYRFTRSRSLATEGYPGLVEAEARLVRELGSAIAASLRELRPE